MSDETKDDKGQLRLVPIEEQAKEKQMDPSEPSIWTKDSHESNQDSEKELSEEREDNEKDEFEDEDDDEEFFDDLNPFEEEEEEFSDEDDEKFEGRESGEFEERIDEDITKTTWQAEIESPTINARREDVIVAPLEMLGRDPRKCRLIGTVLGASIGDAMGHPTEFVGSFEAIRKRFGDEGVTGFELYRDGPNGRFAPFTDDTQMAEVVLRSLLWSAENNAGLEETMTKMAKGFVEWAKHPKGGHRAPGNACLSGCRALERGVHWSKAGGSRAGGCGSVMRAYPFGLFFAHDLARAEKWSVEHSKMTHGDPIALAASASMAIGIARVYRGESLNMVFSEMIAAACRYSPKTAAMMCEALEDAQTGVEPDVTLERLEGWAAHEAIAAALYIFARHPDDPKAAILEGANTPGDSDSLATLAGALSGCYSGVFSIPEEWVRDVERSREFISLACKITTD